MDGSGKRIVESRSAGFGNLDDATVRGKGFVSPAIQTTRARSKVKSRLIRRHGRSRRIERRPRNPGSPSTTTLRVMSSNGTRKNLSTNGTRIAASSRRIRIGVSCRVRENGRRRRKKADGAIDDASKAPGGSAYQLASPGSRWTKAEIRARLRRIAGTEGRSQAGAWGGYGPGGDRLSTARFRMNRESERHADSRA